MREALEEHAAAVRGRLDADARPAALRLFFLASAGRSLAGLVRRGPSRPGRSWKAQLLVDLSRDVGLAYGLLPTSEARRLQRRLARPFPPSVAVMERRIAGVRALEVEPPGRGGRARVIHLHGGGFTLGAPETHAPLSAALALATGASVLSLDYRLAPEHPHPAAIDDVDAVLDALLGAEGTLEGCALVGDSAGGSIALATLVRRRAAGRALPAAAALISPAVDFTLRAPSLEANEPHDYLSRRQIERLVRSYLGDADRGDPAISPLFADLAGLPPLLVHAAHDEVLRDDAVALEARARGAGVDVALRLFDGVFHDFHTAQGSLDEARDAVAELGAFLRRHLARAGL